MALRTKLGIAGIAGIMAFGGIHEAATHPGDRADDQKSKETISQNGESEGWSEYEERLQSGEVRLPEPEVPGLKGFLP